MSGKGCVCVYGKGGVCVWGGVWWGWGASFPLQMGLNPRSLDPVPGASAAARRRPNTTRQHGVNGGSVTPAWCERWFSHTSSV